MSSGTKFRVHWTGREERELAESVYEQGVHTTRPVGPFLAAVRVAQKALPLHRQKMTIAQGGCVRGVESEFNTLLLEKAAEKKKAEEDAKQHASSDEAPPSPEPAPIEQMHSEEAAGGILGAMDGALNVLARALAQRFMTHLKSALHELSEEEIQEYTMKTGKRRRLPRVVIVGLLPQQAGLLSVEYANKLDLRFVESAKAGEIASKVKHSDLVVGFVDKMGHHVEDNIIAAVGKSRYQRTPGGMDSVRNALNSVVAGANDAQ